MTSVTYPIMRPATSPNTIHRNASIYECVVITPVLWINWKSSKQNQQMINIPGINKSVETINWFFKLALTCALD